MGTLWHDMVEGWHIVAADRLLFFSVVQLSMVGIIMQLIAELAGTFVQVILHRPAEDMSIILAPAAIGLVGASLIVPGITHRIGKLRLAFVGFFLLPFGFAAIPVIQWIVLQFNPVNGTSSPLLLWIIVLLVFLLGVLMACVNIPTQTLMQERAPDWGRARVLSLQYMLYSTATIPVLLFAGVVAQIVGFAPFVFLASIAIMAFALWGAWYIRGYSDKQLEPQTP
jgi:MFS family permease